MKKLLVLLMFSLPALAADAVDELSMPTDVGEVVLTVKDCPVKNNYGFGYKAFATDGKKTHAGCWSKDADVVSIWFYDEDESIVATYKDYYFVSRLKV